MQSMLRQSAVILSLVLGIASSVRAQPNFEAALWLAKQNHTVLPVFQIENAEQVKRLGYELQRNQREFLEAIPLLNEALLDDDPRVRLESASAIRAAALKLQRTLRWNHDRRQWEELLPLFENAISTLNHYPQLSRHKRSIEQVIQQLNRPSYAYARDSQRIRSLHPNIDTFVDGFCRFDESAIVDMWKYTRSAFSGMDKKTRFLAMRELIQVAPNRFLEFMATLSNEHDDLIVEILLDSERPDIESKEWLLDLVKPTQSVVRSKLVRAATDSRIPIDSRSAMLRCLTECDPLSTEQLAVITKFCIIERHPWQPECWPLFIRHRKNLQQTDLGAIKRLGMTQLLDPREETWKRAEAAQVLSELFTGDGPVLQATFKLITESSSESDAMLPDLLMAMKQHGASASIAWKPIMEIVRSNRANAREFALAALQHVGTLPTESIEYLVGRIADRNEPISFKVVASKVLKNRPVEASHLLQREIYRQLSMPTDERSIVDLLHAVELVNHRDSELETVCNRICQHMECPVQERLASLHARGICAPTSGPIIRDLMSILQDPYESPDLKATALHTLASVTGNCAVPILSQFTHDEDETLRYAARYAYHLAGESNTAVHLLLAMLPSEVLTDSIERLLREIGDSGHKALVETLNSTTASPEQQQIAFRTLASVKGNDWDRLLTYLDDNDQSELFEQSLRTAWEFDDEIVPALFRKLEKLPTDSALSKRLWRIADDFSGGLGAGGEEEGWAQSEVRNTIASSAKNRPRAAQLPSLALPSRMAESSAAMLPEGPIESSQQTASRPAGTSRAVDVFYGTNRQVKRISTFGSGIRWTAFAVAIGCTFLSIIGFARQRSLAMAITALIGLLGVTALARDSLDIAFWFPERRQIYGSEYSDEVKFGVCQVTIPKLHTPGELESPSLLLRFEVKHDPEKHVVLAKTLPLSSTDFYDQLQKEMGRSGKNLLVFIHGYNVSFEDAARRTAQMAVDLKFPGAPVFYSWPSYSNWYRYPDDAENIQASVGQIRTFLEELANKAGADSINLVAHSMGNVGLTQALADLQTSKPLFNQVVLAAPDIDAKVFREQIAPRITTKARRVTLYTSQTDLALLASRYFNSGDRIGDSSRGIVTIPGIDTIDATSVDSSLLGHSYYGSNVNVLDDIANLLRDLPVGERQYLELQAESKPPYWSFAPQYRKASLQGRDPATR